MNRRKTTKDEKRKTEIVSAKAKQNHKDTLFRMIFSTPESLLSLYNAVNGTLYEDASELEIVTLENALYLNMKNDQAFLMDFQLNLYEHQSTWNPNMPLRFLFYVSKEYQMLIREYSLYAETLIRIPTPRFVVFYNGDGNHSTETESTMHLSNAYQQKVEYPELDLRVRVIDINLEKNSEVLETCRLLKEYMLLVTRIRKYKKTMSLDEALERAVTECMEEDILADFLRKHRAEAIEVCIFEYNEKRERMLLQKESERRGIRALVETMQELNVSEQETCAQLVKKFALSEKEAKKYMRDFWKVTM
ncbi:hypothetical protein [uncultured Clostridium sp.]|uniref:hypothetical protein n=1 Tax=uncultured Clostridium sp. TaxID=59620 RepID=UPI0025E1D16A|nr:hypothetical protein [uncultured Clostridium sp.]